MGDGLVEGLEPVEPVRAVEGVALEVLVEPPVALPPGVRLADVQGLGQVLAHKRVGVDGAAARVRTRVRACVPRAAPDPDGDPGCRLASRSDPDRLGADDREGPGQLAGVQPKDRYRDLRRLPETNIPNGAGFSSAFAKRQRAHSRALCPLPRRRRRARRQARRYDLLTEIALHHAAVAPGSGSGDRRAWRSVRSDCEGPERLRAAAVRVLAPARAGSQPGYDRPARTRLRRQEGSEGSAAPGCCVPRSRVNWFGWLSSTGRISQGGWTVNSSWAYM